MSELRSVLDEMAMIDPDEPSVEELSPGIVGATAGGQQLEVIQPWKATPEAPTKPSTGERSSTPSTPSACSPVTVR
jgi:hypothetical protein